MSMIKKILLTLTLIFVFAGSAFAYGSPRWFNIPVSVQVPKTADGTRMMNAFRAWQSASGGAVRFIFRTSNNMADLSDITVSFVPFLNNASGYIVNFVYPAISSKSANFYKARIVIATNNSQGGASSDSEIYVRMLRAAGEAVGVHNYNPDSEEQPKTITADDIKQIKALYRP